MKYLSVCSGIEAATVAWHHMGWKPVGFSEIEKFPSQVLTHHYPQVTNFGDMTKYKEWKLDETIDLLVGGTPCQSFSVAGLRKGLEDPRGNLMLTYCGILDHFRPQWFVWENVPGVLSSNGGRDFGSFLGAVAELGYGFAYRVLDAQYFGVAQRRRRVFVVGYFGDWRPAAEVLFESESLCRDNPPSRKKGEEIAGTITARFGNSRNNHEEIAPTWPTGNANKLDFCVATTFDRQSSGEYGTASVASTIAARDYKSPSDLVSYDIPLTARMGKGMNSDCNEGQTPVLEPIPIDMRNAGRDPEKHDDMNRQGVGVGNEGDPAHTVTSAFVNAVAQPIALAENTIGRLPQNGGNGNGFTEGGPMYTLNATGVHGVAHPVVLMDQGGSVMNVLEDGTVGTLRRETHGHEPCIVAAFKGGQGRNNNGENVVFAPSDVGPSMGASGPPYSRTGNERVEADALAIHNMAVRRLTPVECERLQGFPDNYTDIKHNGKETPDGPRYKALGNSMAVPCMSWLGKRIQMVEDMTNAYSESIKKQWFQNT